MTTFPSTTECPHCGAVLNARYAQLGLKRLFCGYESCDCEGAVAECAAIAAQEQAEAEKAVAEKRRRSLVRCGVPERYLGLDHPMADELALAMEGGQWLYLWGDVGTRKTTCAAAVAMRLHDRGKSPLMVPMYRVLDEIQRSFHDGGDPLKRYAEAGYLLIDDLGKRRPTGFVLDSLFQLIDQRYSAMRPTLVTTQYRPSDLVRRLAEQGDADTAKAIVSRLRHGARVVEFDGPDRRLA